MLNGKFIGVRESVNVFALEKKFELSEVLPAVLNVTALGVYFAEVNGVRVGEDFLAPGWTSYKKTLQVQEYDITSLLKSGENTLTITVGEGWCCGPFTWQRKNPYGLKQAACADLLVGGKLLFSTDESFSAREPYPRKRHLRRRERRPHGNVQASHARRSAV